MAMMINSKDIRIAINFFQFLDDDSFLSIFLKNCEVVGPSAPSPSVLLSMSFETDSTKNPVIFLHIISYSKFFLYLKLNSEILTLLYISLFPFFFWSLK